MTEQQAESIVASISEAIEIKNKDTISRAEAGVFKSEMRQDLARLEATIVKEISESLKEVKSDIRWTIGTTLTIIGIILAILHFVH